MKEETKARDATPNIGQSLRGAAAIGAAFERARAAGRCALVAYLTLGYPSAEETMRLVPALEQGGADLIELGVPFSDPVADGPAIQRASHLALRQGITPQGCLELTARLREGSLTAPLLLMGYYNPIHHHGTERYARDVAAAGADGLIVPDLPPEEAEPLRRACLEQGLALVFLVAPTTGEARVAQIAEATSGFLYVISRLGTTGAGQGPGPELAERLALIRRHARTPMAVGFGISRPEDARALAPHADGVIVGSAIVERATQGPEALRAYVSSLRVALE